jgi:hypothetical protein
MTRSEWNGLRWGDVVFVHDPSVTPGPAGRGTVQFVTMRGRRGNEVGIRLDDGEQQVVWPTWLAVHRDLTDAVGTCWRCDDVASA